MREKERFFIVMPDRGWSRGRAGPLKSSASDDEDEAAIERMLGEAEDSGEPRAIFAPLAVLASDGVSVLFAAPDGEATVNSPLAAEKLGGLDRAFAYVATCGPELDVWSRRYSGDPLAAYWAEEIKKIALSAAREALSDFIKTRYDTTGYFSSLNPGSLPAWPISGQAELFAALGRERVAETVGVTLTDSFLMLPYKTVSGIFFESGERFHNCSLCPRLDCPSRRAPYMG